MEHPALANLYKEVIKGKWIWDRWGLLSVLSDYVLYYTKGDILEIGCGESSIYLSKLAEKYNRKCYHIEYSKSGVENMKNTKGYFGKNSQVFNMKSEEFFNTARMTSLALAFIDGDHNYEEVRKDFFKTSIFIPKSSYIFLHDSLPPDYTWTVPEKCGTVFKLRKEIEKNEGFECFTFDKSAFNVGLTMVRRK